MTATCVASRDELITLLILIASGGADTVSRLMGWMGSVLVENPDQRRLIVDDRSLAKGAVEEVMRLEPPSYHTARYVTRDVEIHDQIVPEGSTLLVLPGANGHDQREFPDPDTCDVTRTYGHHLSSGTGAHFCIGAALARLEARRVPRGAARTVPRVGRRPGAGAAHPGLHHPGDGPHFRSRFPSSTDQQERAVSEMRFDGRVAIVTGAGGKPGLGRSHTMLLAHRREGRGQRSRSRLRRQRQGAAQCRGGTRRRSSPPVARRWPTRTAWRPRRAPVRSSRRHSTPGAASTSS